MISNFKSLFLLLIICSLGYNCTPDQSSEQTTTLPLKRISSEDSGIKFTNQIENTPDFNIFRYRNFYNGGGVGLGDLNNDGLSDIYFTANMGDNKLYLNKGNLQFEDN